MLPGQPPDILPGLLDAVLDGAVVRTRRALRGREAGAREHPRVFIWGLLEQRLQSAETIVLGGLAEGVWPPLTDSGPWMSRPMRERAGLPSPEERVGQAAHDFTAAACAARRVILSSPGRRNGAPAVPSRWLARMDAYLAGAGASLATHPAAEWARALDQPAGPPVPVRPPAPRPALHLRPRSLSVTEIETWLRDPYAIHAKHILRLEPLEPLDDESDAADYGRVVHQGLAAFLREHGAAWPDDALDRIRRVMERALAELAPRPLLRAWWTPRVGRVAGWVAEHEAIRRADAPPEQVFAELRGEWILRRPGGEFRLIGRADRIERRRDGRLAILDYKTGTPPSGTDVIKGLAPQLPLEACMAAAGAFPEVEGDTAALIYWRLGGGFTPGQETELFRGKPDQLAGVIADAREKLADLIDQFDRASQPYLSHPNPGHAPRFADYAQLARVAEWAAAGDAE